MPKKRVLKPKAEKPKAPEVKAPEVKAEKPKAKKALVELEEGEIAEVDGIQVTHEELRDFDDLYGDLL
jgi:hypothetical protein